MKLVFVALSLMLSAFLSAGNAQEGSVTPNATTKRTVQQAQQRLRELGYDAGVADGAMGARTAAALKKFQLDHSLPGSGVLDQKTLDALNAPTKAQAVPEATPSPARPSAPPPAKIAVAGSGPTKELLIGPWTQGFVGVMGGPGEPLISIKEVNMTLLRDGSLETRSGNSTNDGKWTLHGNSLTLAPTGEPEQTFAIVKVDEGHLTLKATGSERVVEWKTVR
jgi:peptidoglycan hydrolase-like protein with peptidoglycan-binding domain